MFCPSVPNPEIPSRPKPTYLYSFQLILEPDGENLVEKETVKIQKREEITMEQGLEEAKGDGTQSAVEKLTFLKEEKTFPLL